MTRTVWEKKKDRWEGGEMEKQKEMERGTDGKPGSANQVRPGAETRHQICKVLLRKRTFKEHIAKKMSDKQQSHPLRRLLPPFGGKKTIFSETKREVKTEDDKMLL